MAEEKETRWRMARLGDIPAIENMHDEQEALLRKNNPEAGVDRPDLFDRPILLAMMRVEDGEAQGGFYFEAVAELCFIGVDPQVTAQAHTISPQMFSFLKKRGIRWLRCFVPKELESILGPSLEKANFVKQDSILSHYAVDLRETK